ncbi:MAG: flagellar filament capping protein FliD [Bryobacterales bacterium]|nr:flagellar filament capping protein FliD [Bryobacterales bacterium]
MKSGVHARAATWDKLYLSLTAEQTGETTLALRTEAGDNGTNLLTSANQGSNAEFYLNGIQIIRRDNLISNVIDGLTVTIVDTTKEGEEVVIAANSSRGSLAGGLSSLVSSYNALASAVNNHIGENAGVLSGDSILRHIQGVMRTVTGFTGNGDVRALAAIGVTLDKTGSMSFDSTRFYSLSTAEFESALDLMGTTKTGFGALAEKLDEISNPITGLIKKQQDTLDLADTRMDKQIAALQERILVMQSFLSLKLQQADLLISQFSSQQQQLDAVIKSLNTVSFGKEKN